MKGGGIAIVYTTIIYINSKTYHHNKKIIEKILLFLKHKSVLSILLGGWLESKPSLRDY